MGGIGKIEGFLLRHYISMIVVSKAKNVCITVNFQFSLSSSSPLLPDKTIAKKSFPFQNLVPHKDERMILYNKIFIVHLIIWNLINHTLSTDLRLMLIF